MSKTLTQTVNRIESWWIQLALVVGASFFVGLCAHITLPLPFTPVPLTVQNFGVLLVALALGSKRGFAALALYLVEGASGMPVFSPIGAGGPAQLLGPTGGYLLAYPVVAFVVGLIAERGAKSFARYLVAGIAGELVLFLGGLGWLLVLFRGSWLMAAQFGLYPFLFAEIVKVMVAAGATSRVPRLEIK